MRQAYDPENRRLGAMKWGGVYAKYPGVDIF